MKPLFERDKNLELVEHLEEFDGPILSCYVDSESNFWIKKWAHPYLWLYIKTEKSKIDEYLDCKISLWDLLMSNNQKGFLSGGNNYISSEDISIFCQKFLCAKTAMHEADLRPNK